MDNESIKQLATEFNNVALQAFQSGKEHIERHLLAKIERLEQQRDALLAACEFVVKYGLTDREREAFPNVAKEYDLCKAAIAEAKKE